VPLGKQSGGGLVLDHMTRKVFTLRIDKKLIVAEDIMDWAHVRHVPVINATGEVVGMVSHRDLLAASISSVSRRQGALERKQHLWTIEIESVMRSPVITIDPGATVQEAARILRSRKIGCLPVIEDKKLVGIITDYDILGFVTDL